MTTFVTPTALSAWLEVDLPKGTVTLPCTSFNATFALNRIPAASAVLGVGRSVKSEAFAPIHDVLPQLGEALPARIILDPRGQWSTSRGARGDSFNSGFWSDAGPQVVFDGYISGAGYKKVRGSLRASVQLLHWLSDLSGSSIFSGQSHPGNPENRTYQAVARAIGGPATSGSGAFIGGGRYINLFSPNSIAADLWGKALAEVLCDVSQQDLIQLGGPSSCGGTSGKNDDALRALARMEGPHSCGKTESKHYVPLSLDGLGGQGGLLVAKAISMAVGNQSLSSWWSSTVWDKLVNELSPTFLFHVVPLVQTAVVAPYVAGLRSPWAARVRSQDIVELHVDSYVRRPLRGVGIYAGRESQVGNSENIQNLPAVMGVGGCFMPDPDAPGMVILQRAPAWMATIPNFATTVSQTAFGRGERSARPAVTGSSTTPVDAEQAQLTRPDAALLATTFYDRLSQYLYMTEKLRGRNGVLATNFRLDIAPGSTLLLEGLGDQLFSVEGGSRRSRGSTTLVASVLQVSVGLDAEAKQAATAFQLAHVRSAAENEDPRTSVESHPLYSGQKFTGAPLVDEYFFGA